MHRGDELVAMTRNGHDVVVLIRPLAECAPQRRDLADQIVLLHRGIRPYQIQQLVLTDDTVAVMEQNDENVERLCRNPYRSIVAAQRSLVGIDDERTEAIPAVDSRMRSARRKVGERFGPAGVLHGVPLPRMACDAARRKPVRSIDVWSP